MAVEPDETMAALKEAQCCHFPIGGEGRDFQGQIRRGPGAAAGSGYRQLVRPQLISMKGTLTLQSASVSGAGVVINNDEGWSASGFPEFTLGETSA